MEEKALIKKPDMDFSQGILPANIPEVARLAELIHKSNLAPKSFDTIEKVAVGIMSNMEWRRPVVVGLQDLAIINGRVGIYGDASLAQITASGLMAEGYPIEEEKGSPYTDGWMFIYKVKRVGGVEHVGKWSWADAKRAGNDNPMTRDGKPDRYSPWRRYTRRMMQWKARNFVLRDVFGDVLRGMRTVEELHDLDPVEMQETTAGSYETFTPPDIEPDPPAEKTFDDLIFEMPPEYRDTMMLFVDACMENGGWTGKDELMTAAAKDWDAWLKQFNEWTPDPPSEPTEETENPYLATEKEDPLFDGPPDK